MFDSPIEKSKMEIFMNVLIRLLLICDVAASFVASKVTIRKFNSLMTNAMLLKHFLESNFCCWLFVARSPLQNAFFYWYELDVRSICLFGLFSEPWQSHLSNVHNNREINLLGELKFNLMFSTLLCVYGESQLATITPARLDSTRKCIQMLSLSLGVSQCGCVCVLMWSVWQTIL